MVDQAGCSQVSTHAQHGFLQRQYTKAPEFVSRRIADEMLLLPIRKNLGDLESIYTLNEVGTRVWELLDGQRTVEAIRDLLVAEFAVTAATAAEDLADFLCQLEQIEAVTTVGDDWSPPEGGQV